MRPDVECGICLMHWVHSRVAAHTTDAAFPAMTRGLLDTLLRDVRPGVNLGGLCNTAVWSAFRVPSQAASHYEALKKESNRNAAAVLPLARSYIEKGKSEREKFERACSLAAASNVAPLNSPSGAYTFEEIRAIISGTDEEPVVLGDVYGAVGKARQILYIADNAGEVGFDSLVLQMIAKMGQKTVLIVKEQTYFEDATPEDARFFGLEKTVHKIETAQGFFAPGEVPGDLRGLFMESDLILAKGTGSYEALYGETEGKPAIFMLKVKCDPIARQTGIARGKVVVKLEGAAAGAGPET